MRSVIAVAVATGSMVADAGPLGADLDFWYGSGPGNPTAAAVGIGWVQELVSRLTKTPLTTFDTSTNGILDSSNITFPLDQPIYVDASHDTVISQSESDAGASEYVVNSHCAQSLSP